MRILVRNILAMESRNLTANSHVMIHATSSLRWRPFSSWWRSTSWGPFMAHNGRQEPPKWRRRRKWKVCTEASLARTCFSTTHSYRRDMETWDHILFQCPSKFFVVIASRFFCSFQIDMSGNFFDNVLKMFKHFRQNIYHFVNAPIGEGFNLNFPAFLTYFEHFLQKKRHTHGTSFPTLSQWTLFTSSNSTVLVRIGAFSWFLRNSYAKMAVFCDYLDTSGILI